MTARVRDVTEKLVELCRQNIDDPVTMRANSNDTWIYDHFPKYGKNAQLPRIGFHKVSTGHEHQGVGRNNFFNDISDIQVSIIVDSNKHYDFDGDGDPEAEHDLLDYLHREVKEVVQSNQDQFQALEGVVYVVPQTSNTTRIENNKILEALTLETRIADC